MAIIEESAIKGLYVIKGNHFLECSCEDNGCFMNQTYYFNDQLMGDKIVIMAETQDIVDDKDDYGTQTLIQVIHLNDVDAEYSTMYIGRGLCSIEEYAIVKNIIELYNELSLAEFYSTIKKLSDGGISASRQSDPASAKEIREEIITLIYKLKAAVTGAA